MGDIEVRNGEDEEGVAGAESTGKIIRVNEELHYKLKEIALGRRMTLRALCEEFLTTEIGAAKAEVVTGGHGEG